MVEGMRVQELARRAEDWRALLRSFLVLLPWWQANADYRAVDDALPEAQRLALELGDEWAGQTLAQYAGAVRVWQGRAGEGVRVLEASFATVGLPLENTLTGLPRQTLPVAEIVLASTRIAAALGCWLTGRVTDAHRIRQDIRRFAADRAVPQAVAVAAATSAIIAQLDGDRELVASLTAETAQVGDEVTTRQWQQWAAVLRWWAGRTAEEPEVPGPLLRPYFLMLLADKEEVPTERALNRLDEALETVRRTGEQFCEAEILRVRGTVLRRSGDLGGAAVLFDQAVARARQQGAPVLELRALTDRARLPGSTPRVRSELAQSVARLAGEEPTRSLERAVALLESL
jgi:hypothetical protein